MTIVFNDMQELVRKHYAGGDFAHLRTYQELSDCGDGLYNFLLLEAGDAATSGDFWHMLETAIEQLRSLQGELDT